DMRWGIADVHPVMPQRDSDELQECIASTHSGGRRHRPGLCRSRRSDLQTPPPRRTAHRRRALLLLVAAGLVVGLWWGSGYVVAYTDDAYVDCDVVQVT